MKVSREYLDNKISELNHWLTVNPETHPERRTIINDRNNCVDKIIELDKSGLDKVEL